MVEEVIQKIKLEVEPVNAGEEFRRSHKKCTVVY
jgi:hypothetical protein